MGIIDPLTGTKLGEYLMPMKDYFDYTDLKTIFLSLLVCAIWALIVRAWSNHSVKSAARRIKESEAEKVKLDNLTKSDRALIILGFQGVFGMIAILCMILALQTPFFINSDPEGPICFCDNPNLRAVPEVLH